MRDTRQCFDQSILSMYSDKNDGSTEVARSATEVSERATALLRAAQPRLRVARPRKVKRATATVLRASETRERGDSPTLSPRAIPPQTCVLARRTESTDRTQSRRHRVAQP